MHSGKPLRLHRHQADAIGIAKRGESYVFALHRIETSRVACVIEPIGKVFRDPGEIIAIDAYQDLCSAVTWDKRRRCRKEQRTSLCRIDAKLSKLKEVAVRNHGFQGLPDAGSDLVQVFD